MIIIVIVIIAIMIIATRMPFSRRPTANLFEKFYGKCTPDFTHPDKS